MMAAGTGGCSAVVVKMQFYKDIPAFAALVLDQLHDDTCPFPMAAGRLSRNTFRGFCGMRMPGFDFQMIRQDRKAKSKPGVRMAAL